MGISYNTSTVRDGLVLHLDAANRKSYPGTGTAWNDLSGNGNNGTLVNGVGYNSANSGHFLQDNIDDYIDTNYTAPTSNFTVSMWAKRTSSTYWSVLWANEVWTSQLGYVAMLTSSSNLYFGKSGVVVPASTIPNSAIWNYYTFSVDASANFMIYHNAVLLRNYAGTISSSIPKTIKIGTRHGNSGVGFSDTKFGGFGIFSIYDRVLTSVEIQQNFASTRGRYGI